MLGKLIKEELKSYRFSFGIIFLAGLIFTVFMKIISILPYQDGAKEIVQTILFSGYYYIIIIMSVAAQVLIVIRFYSTMVGDRGYLTWTLPASSSTHIWAKLIGGSLWQILANVVMFVLVGIFYTGRYWLWTDDLYTDINGVSLGEFVSEFIVKQFKPQYMIPVVIGLFAFLVWSVMSLLLFYMCIAIGQLFGKWRILASIGCYFIIIILMQIISVIAVVILTMNSVFFAESFMNSNVSPFAIMTGILTVIFVLGLGLDAIFFAVTNSIFKKHLNLE